LSRFVSVQLIQFLWLQNLILHWIQAIVMVFTYNTFDILIGKQIIFVLLLLLIAYVINSN